MTFELSFQTWYPNVWSLNWFSWDLHWRIRWSKWCEILHCSFFSSKRIQGLNQNCVFDEKIKESHSWNKKPCEIFMFLKSPYFPIEPLLNSNFRPNEVLNTRSQSFSETQKWYLSVHLSHFLKILNIMKDIKFILSIFKCEENHREQ